MKNSLFAHTPDWVKRTEEKDLDIPATIISGILILWSLLQFAGIALSRL